MRSAQDMLNATREPSAGTTADRIREQSIAKSGLAAARVGELQEINALAIRLPETRTADWLDIVIPLQPPGRNLAPSQRNPGIEPTIA